MAFTRNVGRVPQNVKVILADGTPAWIRVMTRNKGVTIPEGVTLDPHWHVQNGGDIKHFNTDHDPKWSATARTATKDAGVKKNRANKIRGA